MELASNEPEPAGITIVTPVDFSETTAEAISLEGRAAEAGLNVSINGAPIAADSELKFRTRVALSKGTNAIAIRVTFADGRAFDRKWTVIRNPAVGPGNQD